MFKNAISYLADTGLWIIGFPLRLVVYSYELLKCPTKEEYLNFVAKLYWNSWMRFEFESEDQIREIMRKRVEAQAMIRAKK